MDLGVLWIGLFEILLYFVYMGMSILAEMTNKENGVMEEIMNADESMDIDSNLNDLRQ